MLDKQGLYDAVGASVGTNIVMVNGWQRLGSMAMERMPSIYLFWGSF